MKAYKGFDKDMKCRGFQFEVGKTYEEPVADLCKAGFHACEYPLDILGYYPPESRFAEVELDGVDPKMGDDSKRVSEKISITGEIGLHGLGDAAIKFTFERAIWSNKDKATGYQGAASATGYQGAASATGYQGAASATGDRGAASATGVRGAASATGDQGAASATGDQGAASATGDRGAASATGDRGAASATGYRGAASATGDQGAASATGYRGAASATGDQGAASATGDRGAASATGKESCAISLGVYAKTKAVKGAWITLAEWKEINFEWHRVHVTTKKVDGVKVKADTWYSLVDGKFEETK